MNVHLTKLIYIINYDLISLQVHDKYNFKPIKSYWFVKEKLFLKI